MMQHVLYLVSQLQLGEDGHISDSSDSEDGEPRGQDWRHNGETLSDPEISDIDQDNSDTSTDEDAGLGEDEEVHEDRTLGYEGSDFSLPNGYWLRLSEALFQLSMMFWTHQDPYSRIISRNALRFLFLTNHRLAFSPHVFRDGNALRFSHNGQYLYRQHSRSTLPPGNTAEA
ncbi:hypothetical protein FOXG_21404 [Fusarium oxysporum f. sp. lycopersici 4287]|uniref:Uncharacterized protein n=1 Tax=Fusarium oxysporum f. sp. lycopersici (strain 4287 / CBS 123668 / FGSC 9935 / NRRL 34936) TaxID=426428 RepID=A0A0J9VXU0_FUSO4|nr:hypothetical protein FOXG_21404 [Fusarium oxysporum f. sp. lycopersici 4287]KNB15613.1 hypothetical protein FOXG_21404 [Fusarium oxysporum f. sp. lycopersici 4287]